MPTIIKCVVSKIYAPLGLPGHTSATDAFAEVSKVMTDFSDTGSPSLEDTTLTSSNVSHSSTDALDDFDLSNTRLQFGDLSVNNENKTLLDADSSGAVLDSINKPNDDVHVIATTKTDSTATDDAICLRPGGMTNSSKLARGSGRSPAGRSGGQGSGGGESRSEGWGRDRGGRGSRQRGGRGGGARSHGGGGGHDSKGKQQQEHRRGGGGGSRGSHGGRRSGDLQHDDDDDEVSVCCIAQCLSASLTNIETALFVLAVIYYMGNVLYLSRKPQSLSMEVLTNHCLDLCLTGTARPSLTNQMWRAGYMEAMSSLSWLVSDTRLSAHSTMLSRYTDELKITLLLR